MPDTNESKGYFKPVLISVTSTVLGGTLLCAFGFGGGDAVHLNTSKVMPNDPPTTSAHATMFSRNRIVQNVDMTPELTAAPAYVDLGGIWEGNDGWLYEIQQPVTGQLYAVAMDRNWEIQTLRGNGTIHGHELHLQYGLFDGAVGEAHLALSSDGHQLSGEYRHGSIADSINLRR